jgi:hypothetical protein
MEPPSVCCAPYLGEVLLKALKLLSLGRGTGGIHRIALPKHPQSGSEIAQAAVARDHAQAGLDKPWLSLWTQPSDDHSSFFYQPQTTHVSYHDVCAAKANKNWSPCRYSGVWVNPRS